MAPISRDSGGKPGIFVEDGTVVPDDTAVDASVVVIVASKGSVIVDPPEER